MIKTLIIIFICLILLPVLFYTFWVLFKNSKFLYLQKRTKFPIAIKGPKRAEPLHRILYEAWTLSIYDIFCQKPNYWVLLLTTKKPKKHVYIKKGMHRNKK